mmetsp:Transcript_49894/g.139650  ORF Transcript_49894/g.139650 Transcript_49894/m.139650 type:complete len:250 (+) Transcript_49894:399-1148(+)
MLGIGVHGVLGTFSNGRCGHNAVQEIGKRLKVDIPDAAQDFLLRDPLKAQHWGVQHRPTQKLRRQLRYVDDDSATHRFPEREDRQATKPLLRKHVACNVVDHFLGEVVEVVEVGSQATGALGATKRLMVDSAHQVASTDKSLENAAIPRIVGFSGGRRQKPVEDGVRRIAMAQQHDPLVRHATQAEAVGAQLEVLGIREGADAEVDLARHTWQLRCAFWPGMPASLRGARALRSEVRHGLNPRWGQVKR